MNSTTTISTTMEPPSKEPGRPAMQRPAPRRDGTRRSKRRRLLPWIGALVLVALIVAGLWPKPLPVETVKVTTGSLRVTVNEEGKTRIENRFVVAAPVTGQLRRIPFKAGAETKAGETIVAIIDPLSPVMLDARTRALAEARRDTAAANVERARAAQKFAMSELKRSESLFKDKTVSIQELEQAQWREEAAAKELAAAEAALRQAEAELAEFNIPTGQPSRAAVEVKAPTSGRVLRVIEESARTVTAGMPLVEIGDPADLEVVIEVLSRDGAMIRPGTRVELEQWGGPEPLQARVRLVEPAAFTKISALGVEEQRVNVIADIVTPPEQRTSVGDQFRVEARIVTWEANKVLKVASGAVFRRGEQTAVFLVKDGRAKFQPITTGRTSGAETEIVSGLNEGDEVVIYPGDRINDGDRVKTLRISR
jgi:HlyD family secretion protein